MGCFLAGITNKGSSYCVIAYEAFISPMIFLQTFHYAWLCKLVSGGACSCFLLNDVSI